MRELSKALLAGGLALVAAPLYMSAQAQDYIDLEAERERSARSEATAESRPDPYAPQAARSYPATSFGVRGAPAPTQQAQAPSPVDGGAAAQGAAGPVSGGSASGGGNVGQLFMTVQRLQQEVMRLNGIVEEQAHELRSLREQSLERYVDLDRRLGLLAGADPGAAGGAASAVGPSSSGESAAAPEQSGEREAYQSAYNLVRDQQFDQAVSAFQQFLQDYPAGRFAPNAYYWLGELHLVTRPPDLEAARQSFTLLLELYPQDQKVPDALFKLGKLHFEKGERDKAREFLERVVSQHASSGSGAVNLARDFLRNNY
ncbi:MAG: tol-pal system protein YbgF [Haliea sp.]|nr:tol-pal system protein YbgF [Haliea sp.]|tara:strand:+ start:161553 stop:162497 length:945 start_codon:yes stop_codon:yes gene_type:complete